LYQLQELDKRRESILKSLEERDLLTDELKDKIMAAESMPVLEDLYLPFRPKRRTRAAIAKEKGLEPLAQIIFEQGHIDPLSEAHKFISAEKGVETADQALQGHGTSLLNGLMKTGPREPLSENFLKKKAPSDQGLHRGRRKRR